MVKRNTIRLVVLGILFLHVTKAQAVDSIDCDKYFNELANAPQLITYWSQPPLLKKTSAPTLCELCEMLVCDSCKSIAITLILNKNGDPVCVRIYTEVIHDSLKNEITKLLYKVKFEPATGHNNPTISHYMLIFNTQKCEAYRKMKSDTKKR